MTNFIPTPIKPIFKTVLVCTTILFLVVGCTAVANAFDYMEHDTINTQKEHCKMFRQFDLRECKAQGSPHCEMWDKQKEKSILDCDVRSLAKKKKKEMLKKFINEATHVLSDTGRIVCTSEKSFRHTYNWIMDKNPGYPPYLRGKISRCKISKTEYLVNIVSTSVDNRVVKIDYVNEYFSNRKGYTLVGWLLTREKHNRILDARKNNKL